MSARSSFFEKGILLTKPFQASQNWHQLSFYENKILVQNCLLNEWILASIFLPRINLSNFLKMNGRKLISKLSWQIAHCELNIHKVVLQKIVTLIALDWIVIDENVCVCGYIGKSKCSFPVWVWFSCFSWIPPIQWQKYMLHFFWPKGNLWLMQFPYRRLEENCDECSREENERRDRENPAAHSIYIRTVSS